ncbi:MAG: hypothetical protein ACLUNZ_00235 [Evtepia sp.]
MLPCVTLPAAARRSTVRSTMRRARLGSGELTNLGEETFPQLSKTLGVDLRVDVFTDEGVEDSTVWDIATYVYGNSDYGLGEEKEGISLTLLLRAQPDGSYAMAEKDWCVYTSP